MKTFFFPLLSGASVILALNATTTLAETVTYNINGTTDSGVFPNTSYAGRFQFDDASVTSAFSGSILVSSLQFSFLGENFSRISAATPPSVLFDNGVLLGLNFSVIDVSIGGNTVSFSIVPGLTDLSESFFSYNVNSEDGAGDVTYTLIDTPIDVPEPSISWGLFGFASLGLVSLRKAISKTGKC